MSIKSKEREKQVMLAVCDGLTSKEIAADVGKTKKSVDCILFRLRRRHGAKNVRQLIAIYFRKGWIK